MPCLPAGLPSNAVQELNGQQLMGQSLKVQYDRGSNSIRRMIPSDVREKQKNEALQRKEEEQKQASDKETPAGGGQSEAATTSTAGDTSGKKVHCCV